MTRIDTLSLKMIDWQKITTVFLDMDGTLLDLRFDNQFWLEHVPLRYAERHGVTVGQAKALLFPKMTALKGRLDWYCTDFWSEELSLPIIELKREIGHLIQPREYVKPFLDALRTAGKEIVLFTNAHEDTVALKMEKTGLLPAFDAVITAHSLGLAKENKGVWENLREQRTFERDQALFIDDNFSVLDCAQAYGIRYLLGIAKPDSGGQALSHAQYPLLERFTQIMPVHKYMSGHDEL